MRWAITLAALAAALACVWTPRLAAHDIPTDVIVQVFVRPEGQRLRLVVRAPLAAMRDVEFPLRGPAYLDLARADRALHDAVMTWIANDIVVYEEDRQLGPAVIASVRASLPSNPSFGSYEEALAHVTGPRLADTTDLNWNQGMLDVLLEYPIRSERSRFSIDPALARLGVRVATVVRFVSSDGAVRALELAGNPGIVRLDPRWDQAAFRFVRAGFFHILDGTDHLLFLFCLVIPFRRVRPLILIVTAFTIAHSMTLLASARGMAPDGLWFPPLIETLIAVSILYMALENIVGVATVQRRWTLAFAFGLVHGFGFSFALRNLLQFAGSHLVTSLLAFNIGVELGQLVVLAAFVPALHLLFRLAVAERVGTIILSAMVGHTAWHWMTDRWDTLRQFQWPAVDVVLLAIAVRWLIVLVAIAGVTWAIRSIAARRVRALLASGFRLRRGSGDPS